MLAPNGHFMRQARSIITIQHHFIEFFQSLGPVRPLSNSFILEAFGYGFNNLKRRDNNDIQAQEPRYPRQLEQRRILKKYPDYMFIRETELVRLDDWADKMEKRVVSGEFLKDTKDRRNTSLVRENEHLSELRLEEGGDRITLVVLKKKGLVQ